MLTSKTAGGKTLTAAYSGDASFNGSSGTAPHLVKARPVGGYLMPVSMVGLLAPWLGLAAVAAAGAAVAVWRRRV
jgi:hypothetical protein